MANLGVEQSRQFAHRHPTARRREERARGDGLLTTLRGTAFLYSGEELGLEDAEVPEGRVVDPGGRDGCRSPFPWTRDEGHGWSADPWLPFGEGSERLSVEQQRLDAGSMLHFTRSLLGLRRSETALHAGAMSEVHTEDGVLVFDRVDGAHRMRVMVNFVDEERAIDEGALRLRLSSASTHCAGELGAREAAVFDVADATPVS